MLGNVLLNDLLSILIWIREMLCNRFHNILLFSPIWGSGDARQQFPHSVYIPMMECCIPIACWDPGDARQRIAQHFCMATVMEYQGVFITLFGQWSGQILPSGYKDGSFLKILKDAFHMHGHILILSAKVTRHLVTWTLGYVVLGHRITRTLDGYCDTWK